MARERVQAPASPPMMMMLAPPPILVELAEIGLISPVAATSDNPTETATDSSAKHLRGAFSNQEDDQEQSTLPQITLSVLLIAVAAFIYSRNDEEGKRQLSAELESVTKELFAPIELTPTEDSDDDAAGGDEDALPEMTKEFFFTALPTDITDARQLTNHSRAGSLSSISSNATTANSMRTVLPERALDKYVTKKSSRKVTFQDEVLRLIDVDGSEVPRLVQEGSLVQDI